MFSTKGEARRGQEAAPPAMSVPRHSNSQSHRWSSAHADLSLLLWGGFQYPKVGLYTDQTPARLDSAGARMGAATRAHAAVAQLLLVLHLSAFLPINVYTRALAAEQPRGGLV